MIEQVKARRKVVSSVMVRCDIAVATSEGTLASEPNIFCLNRTTGIIPALRNLNVPVELVLSSFTRGLCSISAYRKLWADTLVSIRTLVALAQRVGAVGWNIYLEEAMVTCGAAPAVAADATAYASWLDALRTALNNINVRLVVTVNSKSAVFGQISKLVPVVDRLFDVRTMHATGASQWGLAYDALASQPRDSIGIALGCYVDAETLNTWSTMAVSVSPRLTKIIADRYPEIMMNRIKPVTGLASPYPAAFPQEFWWAPLATFVSSSRKLNRRLVWLLK